MRAVVQTTCRASIPLRWSCEDHDAFFAEHSPSPLEGPFSKIIPRPKDFFLIVSRSVGPPFKSTGYGHLGHLTEKIPAQADSSGHSGKTTRRPTDIEQNKSRGRFVFVQLNRFIQRKGGGVEWSLKVVHPSRHARRELRRTWSLSMARAQVGDGCDKR